MGQAMFSDLPCGEEAVSSFVEVLKRDLPDPRDNRGKRHSLVLVVVAFVLATLTGQLRLSSVFADLEDPRRDTRNKLHKLGDIVMIVFCAVLSGIEDWAGMEDFALEKEVWLRGFLGLPNGIPSHDTLSDVMGRLEPGAFAALMLRWAKAALPSLAGEQVCVDGKRLRGSGAGGAAVHLVSAYAARARLVLSQQAVAEKANEIVAIPGLLSMLELKGAVVTMDAMGCQKAIARQIAEAGADYVLALKDNRPTLCEEVRLWLDGEAAKGALPVRETVEKDHGRIEIRRYVLGTGWNDWGKRPTGRACPPWAGCWKASKIDHFSGLSTLAFFTGRQRAALVGQ
jgi:predicted transposase YbfD/YdcC